MRQHGDDPDAGHAHQQATGRILLCQGPHLLVERGNLLAQLPPGRQHGPGDRRQIVSVRDQRLDASVKRQAAHRSGQQAERLEQAPDVI
jgi:hypothetical protein